MNRILITERQLQIIIEHETVQNRVVGNIIKYLTSYYEPVVGVFAGKKEYSTSGLITNLVDGATLSPKALKDHLKFKFSGLADDFYDQVISDWFNNKLVGGNLLSRPVSM